MQDLNQAQIGQVAIQRRRGPPALFGQRMYRELHRDAARVPDTRLDALGQRQVMPVAGRQIAAGLGDADDRPPGLQLLPRQAVVKIALDVDRRHIGVRGVVEPFLAAQLAGYLRHG
ncbi:hypothetical protein D3C72_1752780 [compost metagenome]